MSELERSSEIRSSRWPLAIGVIVASLAGLAILGSQAEVTNEPQLEPADSVDRAIATSAPLGEAEDGEADDEVGPELAKSWVDSGASLDLVLTIGKGTDGFELLNLSNGTVVNSTQPFNPVLMFPDYLVANSGLTGNRVVLDSLGVPTGDLPSGAGIMRHPDPDGQLWTFTRDGKSRREFYVFSERDPGNPETVISTLETPQLMVPVLNSDDPRFVAGLEGGIYELLDDSSVVLRAPGLPVSAMSNRVVTWVCDDSFRCALSISDGPDYEPILVESTIGLAGHDGSWTVSSDGEWVVLRDVVDTTSLAVNLESGVITPIDTLAAIIIGDDYAFWIESNQVFFQGLKNDVVGQIDVSGRSRVFQLALGPMAVLDGYSG